MVYAINLNMNLKYVMFLFYLRPHFADDVVAEGLAISEFLSHVI